MYNYPGQVGRNLVDIDAHWRLVKTICLHRSDLSIESRQNACSATDTHNCFLVQFLNETTK